MAGSGVKEVEGNKKNPIKTQLFNQNTLFINIIYFVRDEGGDGEVGMGVYTTLYDPRVKVKIQRPEQIHRLCTLSSGDQQNND